MGSAFDFPLGLIPFMCTRVYSTKMQRPSERCIFIFKRKLYSFSSSTVKCRMMGASKVIL